MTGNNTSDRHNGQRTGRTRRPFSSATKTCPPRQFVRPAIDALAAFAIFAIATMTLASDPSSASPGGLANLHRVVPPLAAAAIAEDRHPPVVEIATTSSPDSADAVYRRTSVDAAWGMLAISFSLLAALNLAFFRHLRCAYAKPRKRPTVPPQGRGEPADR